MLLHAIFTSLSLSWGESRDIVLFTLQAGHIHREDFRMNHFFLDSMVKNDQV